MICGSLRNRVQTLRSDYVRLQYIIVILLYTQIGCAMIGSLGALYNGVLLMNLVIALFALVAIENNSQSLGRTYAILLFCAILLDISWFILFSKEIWNISFEMNRGYYIFSVKLTMAMEMAGFGVRLLSSLLWFQIYRLGAFLVDTSFPRQSILGSPNSFVDPPLLDRQYSRCPELQSRLLETPEMVQQRSRSEEILGESIDGRAYYTPLFYDGRSKITSPDPAQVIKHHSTGTLGTIYKVPSSPAAEASRNKSSLSRSLELLDSSLP